METERCPFNGVDCEYIPLAQKVTEQANEIERLRDEVFNLQTEVHFDDQAIKSFQVVNERLREALESFSCDCETEDDCCAVGGSFCGWVARAALKEGK
jgi:predicted nuclease with TOPRIM domain